MADTPVVGGDKNVWGTKLNTFLAVAHEITGANGGKLKHIASNLLLEDFLAVAHEITGANGGKLKHIASNLLLENFLAVAHETSGSNAGRVKDLSFDYYANSSESNQGITGNGATIKAAIDNIGSANKSIALKSGNYTLATSLTIPSNVTLIILPGAKITKSASATLTINGFLICNHSNQWLSGFAAGDILVGTKIDSFLPEWVGGIGDGTTDDTTAISVTQAVFGSNSGTIIFTKSFKTVGAFTFLENIHLCFKAGGMIIITGAAGTFIRIGGTVEAGSYQIFSSTLAAPVLFGSGARRGKQDKILATWFGAKGDDGTTDNSVPLSQFLLAGNGTGTGSGSSGGPQLFIPAGTYHYSTGIVIGAAAPYYIYGLYVEGAIGGCWGTEGDVTISSNVLTRLHYTGSGIAIQIGTQTNLDTSFWARVAHFKNILFTGTSLAAGGLKVATSTSKFENLTVSGFRGAGVYGVNCMSIGTKWTNCSFAYNTNGLKNISNTTSFKECYMIDNANYGALDGGGMGSIYDECVFQGNDGEGLSIDGMVTSQEIKGTRVRDCWFESNHIVPTGSQLYIRGLSTALPCTQPVISGNVFVSGGVAGVKDMNINANVVNPIITRDNVWHNPSYELLNLEGSSSQLNNLFYAKTSNFQITPSYNGQIFTNEGASGAVTFTLPSANFTGLTFTFIKIANFDLIIKVDNASDIINRGTAGKKYRNNTASEDFLATCTVVCTKNNYWQVLSEKGTWSNDNT